MLQEIECHLIQSRKMLKDAEVKLVTVRGQLKRTYKILLSQKRYEIRQFVSRFKCVIDSRFNNKNPIIRAPTTAKTNIYLLKQQLRKVFNHYRLNLLKISTRSPKEVEDEFVCMRDLIEMCTKLNEFDLGLGIIECLASRDTDIPHDIWLFPKLLFHLLVSSLQ